MAGGLRSKETPQCPLQWKQYGKVKLPKVPPTENSSTGQTRQAVQHPPVFTEQQQLALLSRFHCAFVLQGWRRGCLPHRTSQCPQHLDSTVMRTPISVLALPASAWPALWMPLASRLASCPWQPSILVQELQSFPLPSFPTSRPDPIPWKTGWLTLIITLFLTWKKWYSVNQLIPSKKYFSERRIYLDPGKLIETTVIWLFLIPSHMNGTFPLGTKVSVMRCALSFRNGLD